MAELTKEWLQKTINDIEDVLNANPNSSNDSDVVNTLTALKIAQASLDAKPVAWTDDEELRDVERTGCGYILRYPPDKCVDPRLVIPLYRHAPPAPVVPDERPSLNNGIVGFDEGWNACRAAMLKLAQQEVK